MKPGTNMKCPECGTILIIDEWNGWVWTCFYCDHISRKATEEEVREWERGYYTPED